MLFIKGCLLVAGVIILGSVVASGTPDLITICFGILGVGSLVGGIAF